MSKITDFIRERLVEDFLGRRVSKEWYVATLDIIKVHDEIWPVLAYGPKPTLSRIDSVNDFNTVSFQLQQNMEWHTRDSYFKKFGEDPPTNPIVLSLARIWKSHPNFQSEWT